jgi:hypothetical protein
VFSRVGARPDPGSSPPARLVGDEMGEESGAAVCIVVVDLSFP